MVRAPFARFALASLVALARSGALASAPSCPLARSEGARNDAFESLRVAFEEANFDATRGAMWIFGYKDIDPDCEDCYHANPSSTYGCPMLPLTDDPRALLRRSVARESLSSRVSRPSSAARGARTFAVPRPSSSSSPAARTAAPPTSRRRDAAPLLAASRVDDNTTDASTSSARHPPPAPGSTLRRPPSPLSAVREVRRNRARVREIRAAVDAPALGLARLPPDAPLARVLPLGPELSCEWNLRDDEVVLVLGCAPGPAKYFGITPYLYRAYQGASARTLFASLGDSLSAGVAGDVTTTDASAAAAAGGLSPARRFARLATSGTGPIPRDSSGRLGVTRDADANCWNGQFAVAVGKHRATLDRAVEIMRGRGLQQVFAAGGDGLYNTTPVTAYGLSRQVGASGAFGGLVGGLGPGAVATHAMVLRHAVPRDEAAWDAYASNPPFVVARLTPKRRPLFPSPFPKQTLIARETADERALRGAVTAVANRIAAFFREGGGFSSDSETPWTTVASAAESGPQVLFDNGQSCVDVGWNCGGDNRDTTYLRGPSFGLPSDRSAAFVVGVNHAATGNAFYSTVAAYVAGRNLGVAAADDSMFERTAIGWGRLAGVAEADAAKLYVVALARRCPPAEAEEAEETEEEEEGEGRDPGGGGGRGRGGRAGISSLLGGALCVEVPETGFPSASREDELVVWERPYAHLGTTVGPWWSRLALPAVVSVDARPPGIGIGFDPGEWWDPILPEASFNLTSVLANFTNFTNVTGGGALSGGVEIEELLETF